jgi:primosomal protein N' (replication factor Y) (superfamily II helicase)
MTSGSSPAEARLVASVVPLVSAWRLDRAFDYLVPKELAGRAVVGSLVRVPLGARRVRGVVLELATKKPDRVLQNLAAVVLDEPVAPPHTAELMEWISRRYVSPLGAAYARAAPGRVRISAPGPEPIRGGPVPERVLAYDGGRELIRRIEQGHAGAALVECLPTEDRGALIAELVAATGRAEHPGQCLVAVPEVRYGSTVLEHLASLWPETARVDSSRAESERARSWLRLARGHGLGAGGRGVLLAPAPRAALIVIDEEQHPSYKEDRAPRWHGRGVALERARIQGASCVLLSSAPSVVAAALATQGRLAHVRPLRAARRRARPLIEVTPPPRGRTLSAEVHERIARALRAEDRVALLVPRRGYAPAVWCAACRRTLRCPRCEAGLFSHMSPPGVRCPRCGYAAGPMRVCPSCKSPELVALGAGSERVSDQVARAFPRATVARMDPAVLQEEGKAPPPADIYVTTWIGTKPALRPPSRLVCVLGADALLRRPDWRSAEDAWHALAAMAEWAGPAESGGHLVIETAEPGHHAVQALVRADPTFFVTRELESRAELAYPPYSELIKVTAAGPRAPASLESCAVTARIHGARVLGPVPVSSQPGRFQLLLKCRDATKVGEDLRGILAQTPAGTRLMVDVDPS